MFVEKTEDEKHYRLIYNYWNEGSIEQGFSPHYGTEVLKFMRKDSGKFLSGINKNYKINRKYKFSLKMIVNI